MSVIRVSASSLRGEVTLPPSKSAAHRAIICAALAKGASVIHNIAFSKDIEATCEAVAALGVKTSLVGNTLYLNAKNLLHQGNAVIDCGESGSTLRFLVPVAAAAGVSATFTGRGRLPQRPIGTYLELLPDAGVSCESAGGLPLAIEGRLSPGEFTLPGNISSQFITGLLLALPTLSGGSRIRLSSPLESAGYVELTLEMMKAFGVFVTPEPDGWLVPGNQRYQPRELTVEGDWSQAAFFLAAGALSQNPEDAILLKGLSQESIQGDQEAFSLFGRFGARLSNTAGGITVAPGKLTPIREIDASQIPDLVPMLAFTAAFCPGVTAITGAARLRIKESDRLLAVSAGIRAIGGEATETADGLVIAGKPALPGGHAEGFHDHRIVMALAIASLRCDGPVTITDAESVAKSYPGFFEDFKQLGGIADAVNLG